MPPAAAGEEGKAGSPRALAGGLASPCISEKCRGGSRTMVRALEKKMHASLLVYLRVQRFQASQQSFSSSPPHPKRSKRACCRFGAAAPNRQHALDSSGVGGLLPSRATFEKPWQRFKVLLLS